MKSFPLSLRLSVLLLALTSVATAQLQASPDLAFPSVSPTSSTAPAASAMVPPPPTDTPTPLSPSSSLPKLAPSLSSSPISSPFPSPSSSSSALPLSPISFTDVTESVGIIQPISEQFGGATIADVNSDGHYDLILTYHNRHPTRLYLGSRSGKFVRSPFSVRADIHGVCVAPRTALSQDKLIAVSVGGGRGTTLRPPFVFLAKPDNSISTITNQFGLGEGGGRGRVPVFMDMAMQSRELQRANGGGPDVLFINLLGGSPAFKQFAYQNVQGNYSLHDVPGFSRVNEERAIITDVDNDGVMELVHFSVFRVFRLVAPFTFRDVTRAVWPGWRNLQRSVSAIVELDFNNDGRMDLYIARARSALVTPRGPPSVPEHADVLLMNAGGSYVDVSRRAGVPVEMDSMGVTAEDFDNDGYVDVLVTTFEGPDVLLLNNGDGTFRSVDPATSKPETTRGANVMAMDYDLDGRVDYLVGHGLRKAYSGKYHLMRNVMPLTESTNYLLVRVGNEETLACTSLNALVTVWLPNGEKLVRRVGGRGAQSGGQSYIDTVHFGLGQFTRVSRVSVVWTTRASQDKVDVGANQLITFGSSA